MSRPQGLKVRHGGVGVCLAIAAVAWLGARPASAVTFGQIDTFAAGIAGWSEGPSSPNAPAVITAGGPGGAADAFLQNVSSGSFGAGGKQVMFNRSQWAGNWIGAGITRIEMDLSNGGTTDLTVRLALQGDAGSRFGTAAGVSLPAGAGWTHATFDVSTASLANIGAFESVDQVMSSVTELRLLSAASGPGYIGDDIAASLNVDNIRALRRRGDATFNDRVDFDDLLALAKNYNKSGPSINWSNGDFDFDQDVDFDDLLALAKNYNTGVATGSASATLADAIDVGGPAFGNDWAQARSLVPEPTLALLSAGGPMAVASRRRRHVASR